MRPNTTTRPSQADWLNGLLISQANKEEYLHLVKNFDYKAQNFNHGFLSQQWSF